MSRIKSDFWAAAHLRRCALDGVDAVLRRRGSPEAGAIFVSVDHLGAGVDLYAPAMPSFGNDDDVQDRVSSGSAGRTFECVMALASPLDVEARMSREIRFDQDLWWLAIDDREGRSLLDIVGSSPGPRG